MRENQFFEEIEKKRRRKNSYLGQKCFIDQEMFALEQFWKSSHHTKASFINIQSKLNGIARKRQWRKMNDFMRAILPMISRIKRVDFSMSLIDECGMSFSVLHLDAFVEQIRSLKCIFHICYDVWLFSQKVAAYIWALGVLSKNPFSFCAPMIFHVEKSLKLINVSGKEALIYLQLINCDFPYFLCLPSSFWSVFSSTCGMLNQH